MEEPLTPSPEGSVDPRRRVTTPQELVLRCHRRGNVQRPREAEDGCLILAPHVDYGTRHRSRDEKPAFPPVPAARCATADSAFWAAGALSSSRVVQLGDAPKNAMATTAVTHRVVSLGITMATQRMDEHPPSHGSFGGASPSVQILCHSSPASGCSLDVKQVSPFPSSQSASPMQFLTHNDRVAVRKQLDPGQQKRGHLGRCEPDVPTCVEQPVRKTSHKIGNQEARIEGQCSDRIVAFPRMAFSQISDWSPFPVQFP
jgi:hypothetical protein